MNIYGPYNNRVEFWDYFKNFDISRKENLIIGGDLNFLSQNFSVFKRIPELHSIIVEPINIQNIQI